MKTDIGLPDTLKTRDDAYIQGEPPPSEVDFRAEEMREADQDRAVVARRKAGEKRHIAAIAGTTEWVHDRALWKNPRDGWLPESAFDWPIYIAGMAGRYGEGALFNWSEDRRIEKAVDPRWRQPLSVTNPLPPYGIQSTATED
jgi:hypothetical protein